MMGRYRMFDATVGAALAALGSSRCVSAGKPAPTAAGRQMPRAEAAPRP